MVKASEITVNVKLNGPLDVEKIAEEVKVSIFKEMERVGINVDVPAIEPLKKEADAKWAKIGRKPNEFKKGDIVRVIDASESGHEYGDVSEITDNSYILYEVKVIRPSDTGGWLCAEDMELIAPVESRVDF